MKDTENLRRILALVPLIYFRLQAAGDRVHATRGLTTGMRGLLISLDELGPTTAVRLADLRPVSRQAMHKLAQQVIARGLVRQIENDGDKRAPLLCLTAKGKAELGRLRAVETPQIDELFRGLQADDVERVLHVLETISRRLSPSDAHDGERVVKRASVRRR